MVAAKRRKRHKKGDIARLRRARTSNIQRPTSIGWEGGGLRLIFDSGEDEVQLSVLVHVLVHANLFGARGAGILGSLWVCGAEAPGFMPAPVPGAGERESLLGGPWRPDAVGRWLLSPTLDAAGTSASTWLSFQRASPMAGWCRRGAGQIACQERWGACILWV